MSASELQDAQLAPFLLALESAGVATWVWTPQTGLQVSGSLPKIFALPADRWSTRVEMLRELLHPDDRVRLENEFSETLLSRETFHHEFRLLAPEGTVRWVSCLGSVDRQEGHPVRLSGIAMNITEKKQLESRFLRSQRLESIGTLVGGIAHDLNNILTPIRLSADLLHQPMEEQKKRLLLDAIIFSVNRGVDLLTQLLDFARGQETDLRPLAPGPILVAIARLLEQTLPRSIRVMLTISADLGRILGDTTQLSQVLVNLALNARDAMPEGGELRLSASNVVLDETAARAYPNAVPGPYIQLAVSDTGVGIQPDILDRIFDPFFTTKEVGKGSGLGLSTVQGIVKRHRGFLDVESAPQKGSTFRIWLPVCEAEVQETSTPSEFPSGDKQVILVIDDEPQIRSLVEETLQRHGYRVRTAANGAEGLAVFHEHTSEIAAVLVDLIMPVLDGATTIRALRQTNREVPILSASGLPPGSEVLSALGVNGFLAKPFTSFQLLHAVRQLLERPGQTP